MSDDKKLSVLSRRCKTRNRRKRKNIYKKKINCSYNSRMAVGSHHFLVKVVLEHMRMLNMTDSTEKLSFISETKRSPISLQNFSQPHEMSKASRTKNKDC